MLDPVANTLDLRGRLTETRGTRARFDESQRLGLSISPISTTCLLRTRARRQEK